MDKLGAVILAAGISSRMDAFKPMLQVCGETLISRIISVMKQAGANPIVVVTGYRGDVIAEHLKGKGVVLVHNDRFWETQMLDSLLLGLEAVGESCGKVLISPVDVPLVKPETVRKLLQSEGEFVRPLYRGRPGHPVLIKSGIIPAIKSHEGTGGLRGAVESGGIAIKELEVDDPAVVLSCNTEEEYVGLLRYMREQFRQPLPLQPELNICLRAEDVFWGPATAQLLELVEITGSLQTACKCMHMDDLSGREKISEIERQLGYEILVPEGQQAKLTKKGKHLLDAYQAMRDDILKQAQFSFEKYFGDGSDFGKRE